MHKAKKWPVDQCQTWTKKHRVPRRVRVVWFLLFPSITWEMGIVKLWVLRNNTQETSQGCQRNAFYFLNDCEMFEQKMTPSLKEPGYCSWRRWQDPFLSKSGWMQPETGWGRFMKRANFTRWIYELFKATIVKGRGQSKQNGFVKEGIVWKGQWHRAGCTTPGHREAAKATRMSAGGTQSESP